MWYPSIFTCNVGFLQKNILLPLEGCVRTKSHIWSQYTGKFLNYYLWKGWGKSPAKEVPLPFPGLTGCYFSLFSSILISHSRLERTNYVPCFPENASDNLSRQLKLTDLYTLLTFVMLRQMRTNSAWIFVRDPFIVLYLSTSLPLCCSCCASSWKWEARDHISF